MAVKVHETGYGKWKVPVIIIAVIVVLSLAGTGILLSDSLGVSIEEGSKRIEVICCKTVKGQWHNKVSAFV